MASRTLRIVIACLLLLASLAPVVTGTSQEQVTIADASYSGPAVAGTENGTVMLWRSEPHVLNVTIASSNVSKVVEICAAVGDENETNNDSVCQTARLSNETAKTFTFQFEEWPANESLGEQTVAITVESAFGKDETFDRRTVLVRVLEKDADADGDGLTNEHETMLGTDIANSDTDGDGLRDGEEVNQYETDPTKVDSDNDGLRDGEEISRGTNATDADTDGDGLGDGAEVGEHGTNPTKVDTDGDGLADGAEIEEYGTDPTKTDTDGDGLPDDAEIEEYGTDPTKVDSDGDGIPDDTEIEEYGTDPTKVDSDGDGLGDATEIAFGTDPNDAVTPLAYVLVGIALVAGGVVALGRRLGPPSGTAHAAPNGGSKPDPGATPDSPAEPRLEAPPAATNSPPPDALVTDEDRVLQLLEQNGGRLQQSVIVEETDWSKSKVSRLLSKMETNSQIKKITIGRENLITYPSDEPLGPGPGDSSDG